MSVFDIINLLAQILSLSAGIFSATGAALVAIKREQWPLFNMGGGALVGVYVTLNYITVTG